jgi:hypothetical protein
MWQSREGRQREGRMTSFQPYGILAQPQRSTHPKRVPLILPFFSRCR